MKALGRLRHYCVKSTDQMVDFSNTEKAYHFKSFGELLRHYLVYKLFSVDILVRNSNRVSVHVRVCGSEGDSVTYSCCTGVSECLGGECLSGP